MRREAATVRSEAGLLFVFGQLAVEGGKADLECFGGGFLVSTGEGQDVLEIFLLFGAQEGLEGLTSGAVVAQ